MLFMSGMCALIYQTVWLREFRLIFGASTAASAAVLGIFMGGLGIGSAVLGKRSEKTTRPLLMYGKLELWIACSAAVTPFLLILVQKAYTATGGSMHLGSFIATMLRLLLSTLVLITPTFLMGGTLPALARAVSIETDVGRRGLALLYGCNAFGAVTGVAFSTFFLIEALGNRGTLWVACILNLLVAVIAISRGRKVEEVTKSACVSNEVPDAKEEGGSLRFVMLAAFGVGFAFMLMELVWYRMLSPLLGGSTFTFGVILLVALFGIGGGGALYALFGAGKRPTIRGFALSCALEAFLIAVPFAAGDKLAYLAATLKGLGVLGFGGHVFGWSVITCLVVLPAAIVAGYQFPMLIALLGGGHRDVGKHTGMAYTANTAGAITGSLAGGFGLLPLLTAPGAWRGVVVLLACLAFLAVGKTMHRRQYSAISALLIALLAVSLLFCKGPTEVWRHSSIGAGRAHIYGKTPNELEEWGRAMRRSIVWEQEGVESSVAIRANSSYSFVINGKSDGNAIADAGTQVMGGLLGALLHPAPKSSMVIGLGTGSTAGWLGAIPQMEQVDVVELEPAILEVARMCSPVNKDVLHNSKVKIYLGDAREALLSVDRSYDIIFSEPSNPFRAGIASLFTQEFYEAAATRLNKHGIFLQWVQGYEIDGEALQTVYATLLSVFPHVQTWQTLGGDMLMVATKESLPVDVSRLKERVQQEPYRSALLSAWRVFDVNGVLAHFVGNEMLAKAGAGTGVVAATDDRNSLEFGFARGLGKLGDESVSIQAARYAREKQWNRPTITGGEVDWSAVEAVWVSGWSISHMRNDPLPSDDQTLKARWLFAACMQNDNFGGAATVWSKTPFEPLHLEELEFLVLSLINSNDPRMQQYLDKMRDYSPITADALHAYELVARQKWDEAADFLPLVWSNCQKNPWISQKLLMITFKVTAQVIATCTDKSKVTKLNEFLYQPLATENMRNSRLELCVSTADSLAAGNFAQPDLIRALDIFGADFPWIESMLQLRVRVYKAQGDSRLEEALDDYLKYRGQEAVGFRRGL